MRTFFYRRIFGFRRFGGPDEQDDLALAGRFRKLIPDDRCFSSKELLVQLGQFSGDDDMGSGLDFNQKIQSGGHLEKGTSKMATVLPNPRACSGQ